MLSTAAFIHITGSVEGLHHWPDATAPDGYLRQPHRHLFVVTAQIQVHHDDREIEINAAARWLTTLLPTLGSGPPTLGEPVDFGPQSCEHLGRRITAAISHRYGEHRAVTCTVLEDGLLGAGINWQPTTQPPAGEPPHQQAVLQPPPNAAVSLGSAR